MSELNISVTINLPEIKGFKYTGEFRCPNVNEYYLNACGRVVYADPCGRGLPASSNRFLILVRIGVWRARRGELYYYVSDCGSVSTECESYYERDKDRWVIGNYFLTKDLASKSNLFAAFQNELLHAHNTKSKYYDETI